MVKEQWLRLHFEIDDTMLPGKAKCSMAREALERHKAIQIAKDTVFRGWDKMVPEGMTQCFRILDYLTRVY